MDGRKEMAENFATLHRSVLDASPFSLYEHGHINPGYIQDTKGVNAVCE